MNFGDKFLRIWGASPEQRPVSRGCSPDLGGDHVNRSSVLPPINSSSSLKLEETTSLSPSPIQSLAHSLPALSPVGSPTKLDLSKPSTIAGGKTLRPKPSIASLASNHTGFLNLTSSPAPPVTLGKTASNASNRSSETTEDITNKEKLPPDKEIQNRLESRNGKDANGQLELPDQSATTRSRTWSFWKSAEVPDRKEFLEQARSTNRILQFTPVPQSGEVSDSQNDVDIADSRGQDSKHNDAVLYKPHHSAKEFSKIDTHKSENIPQNIIVPSWELCLPLESASKVSDVFSTTGATQSFDLKSWFQYLTSFSLRLGFKGDENVPPSMLKEVSKDSPNLDSPDFKREKYRLYGKCLTRLPSSKKACLNPPVSSSNGVYRALKRRKTQLEEDANDENAVSISNESGGKLLINPDSYPSNSSPSVVEKLKRQIGHSNKIKRILVIGVHGFFPNKMIRPIIGNPTGTSLKFANEAEKAIIRYCVENDMMSETDARDMSIRKIALEKEGKIFDRTSFFLEVLTKWQLELNEADCIFFAAHSQGCVVSILLLARLITEGILKNSLNKKLGLLCMAGVNNGPFFGVDKSLFMKAYSAFEHESMLELFELTKFNSPQSIAYKEAMKTIIAHNGKLCFIGSIDDQLVPLYSALSSHIYHPNIYRACYIDQSAKSPQFINHLVQLCLQLQNLGYFDNGVIKELSAVLAGPITGGGHSKIYNDGKVYDLGLKFLLDTSDLVVPVALENGADSPVTTNYMDNQVHIKEYNVSKLGVNPFVLPWCLRGLLFNVEKNWRLNGAYVGDEGDKVVFPSGAQEVKKLYDTYDNWRADTKIHKELKFRLNGIRSSKL